MLAQQEANRPVRQKPVSSLEQFDSEKKRTTGTLYNPDNLTGDEQKVRISICRKKILDVFH